MASTTHPHRELRFVTVSGQKSHSRTDKQELRSVRAFVMRDYLRQKNDPTWTFRPAKVDDHITSHISRFRSSRPPSIVGPRKKKPVTPRERDPKERSRGRRPLVPAPTLLDGGDSRLTSPHDLDMLDAFNILKVDLDDPDTQNLLQYYQKAFGANSYACNPEARWISVALMDPAIIHATLSLVAIHRRDCFSVDLSKVYFQHRGEAMKIVARRLSNMNESLSDQTIGAVALLSSSDNHFDWPPEAQTTHSQGLGQLIAMRGGMEKLNSNKNIQRVAGWADLLQSAMHGSNLHLAMPAVVQKASADDVEQRMVSEEKLPPGIVLRDLPSTIATPLRQLRVLSSLKVSLLEKRDEQLCLQFSHLLWKLEYSILDQSEHETHGPRQRQPTGTSKHELVSKVVNIAMLMFSYLTLRDLAAPILYKRLCARLQDCFTTMMTSLDQASTCYLEEGELAVLLWSLFLGWRGSWKDINRQASFTHQVAQLCWRHAGSES